MTLRYIQDVGDIKGKKALLRASLNVPVEGGKVANDFRLRRALSTIRFLKGAGAKIILIGHIGRNPSLSFAPVYEYLKKHIPLVFIKEIFGSKTNEAIDKMKNGDIVLLENMRTHEGERANDKQFAKELASLADIYVNDAFSVSHRKHASVIGLPRFLPSYAGLLFKEEVEELSGALHPPSPSLCILGGAKFRTKEPLIRKFLNVYDKVFISGALAHDFFKMHGFNIGKSLTSYTDTELADIAGNTRILLPVDVTVENSKGVFTKRPSNVSSEDNIVDSGPETSKNFEKLVQDFKFILWNGPLGEYEHGFVKRTEMLACAIANSPAKTLVGGGDTIASIAHLNLWDKFSFVSTGGGSMLEFLLKGTLPGIEALKQSKD